MRVQRRLEAQYLADSARDVRHRDATTYPNTCNANLAGVSVERQGACATR